MAEAWTTAYSYPNLVAEQITFKWSGWHHISWNSWSSHWSPSTRHCDETDGAWTVRCIKSIIALHGWWKVHKTISATVSCWNSHRERWISSLSSAFKRRYNGRTIKVKVQNQEIEIGNKFIVPYCPLLSRIFETHANVESCHSAKSIKYLCKYVTEGSDMAVFGIASENANDEISNFQMGRHVSTNEALWRLLSFQIHERYPTVVHLAVHLENGQSLLHWG